MLDRFPILGTGVAGGRRHSNADLDACQGKLGPAPIDVGKFGPVTATGAESAADRAGAKGLAFACSCVQE